MNVVVFGVLKETWRNKVHEWRIKIDETPILMENNYFIYHSQIHNYFLNKFEMYIFQLKTFS